jgi:phosphoglycerate dehydrogenase-like enzyme
MSEASDGAGLLVSGRFLRRYGDELERAEAEAGLRLERIALSEDSEARLASADCERVALAFFSPDVFPDLSRPFVSAIYRSPNLRWLQVFNAGVDHDFFQTVMQRGVRLSTAAGTSAEPIALTAIAALLFLARGFPHWIDAQRRRAWETLPSEQVPHDLRGQTLLVVGLGGIGAEIARLGRALGLHVVGVRRSPRRPDDPVDELYTPDRLPELLPRADWLALACPLTPETRGLIDAEALTRLPRGAHLLNVGRGEVVDQAALVEALRKGELAGAYLDVFEVEPLPPTSPLWELPNVLVTPHNSAASRGNERRQVDRFFVNLVRWGRGEPLLGEV